MRWQSLVMLLVPVLALAATAPAQTQPGQEPASAAVDPAIDAILTRMEARQIRDLEAQMTWELRYTIDLPDEKQVKQGTIWYGDADPIPKFKVELDKKIDAGRPRQLDEEHLFDGEWYVEKNPVGKTVTRRQVRRPDDRSNPYRLGEGPFPVPFGQKKADILRWFDVKLVPPAADDPRNTDHLVCTPKPSSDMADKYAQVDFWIVRSGDLSGLPVKLRAAKLAPTGRVDSHLTVSFEQPRINQGVNARVFRIQTPLGWNEVVEKLGPPGGERPAP
jgi:hypothetical protein